ncbi:MAG TPA: serine/threonine-protein kinase, partial [Polyangiales bacterium]|nr:serine/threonine-protein kinase [Polyangiales bacterium]
MIGRKLGRYTIVRLLGSGGMGSVYYAEHDRLRRPAAIKIVDAKLLTNPQMVERFHNEAQLAALLKHAHLIDIYDHDQDPATGALYMALEYLAGQTLSEYLNEHPGPADPKLILRIVAHVASALKVVHARGAVHRDIKPDNIFLTERNGEKLFAVV